MNPVFDPQTLIRKEILNLKPYSSARDEYTGSASVLLDANENPYNSPLNRYPDPQQWVLKRKIAGMKGVEPEQIFLGNGSDEAIDLLIRIFCEPLVDQIFSIDPSYGMYEVCAAVNNVKFIKFKLTHNFEPDVESILKSCSEHTKLLFLCSPNNPTSNSFEHESIIRLLDEFRGIVVLDEAYIDFSINSGYLPMLDRYPRLVILQTLSKAWGLAGIRLGMAFASKSVITILNKVKYPYNVNLLSQQKAIEALENPAQKSDWVKRIILERERLRDSLAEIPCIVHVFPSDANFLLVKTTDPAGIYNFLVEHAIIVRDRSRVSLCEGCLRITIGTPEENEILCKGLKAYMQ
jgi:histidinol-phosphate aminotransferase